MALVQYSDSESEEDASQSEISPRPAKRLRQESTATPVSSLPPLPNAFHDLYASSTRISVKDDPSLHGGRKRAIPHVEGNWPTHIYLEWYPSKGELFILSSVIAQVEGRLRKNKVELNSLLRSDLGAQLPLHISLSRPVVLRTEQRQSFLETFKSAIQDSNIRAFNTTTEGLHCVSNYEKTRWFYVLRVKKPENDALNCLLKLSNRSLALFSQPPLYGASPHVLKADAGASTPMQWQRGGFEDYSHCFHISLAWSLTEPSPDERDQIAKIELRELSDLRVYFDRVKAKIGNHITSIPLASLLG
ncbi:U6 snRNA phosphodiesterase Usb1 [Aspergillus pseudotamarii]|uniref:U6 snRNA phosphodiesterase n=1 Tax=Aspergillus pseudotamarii TaxID=132259 RepID=A0A5N6T3Z2_ASPPS|nr:U6 snRNA phosphodiesterase Usb1 [Aspergillus pseudotamarii]KAE8140979.1 U6 snRNA phosphodiesterase Usb1 [Aspergillus pseudotamarii]